MEEDDDLIPELSLSGQSDEDIPEITLSAPTPPPAPIPPTTSPVPTPEMPVQSFELGADGGDAMGLGVGEAPPVYEKENTSITKVDILEDPAKLAAVRTYMTKRMGTIYAPDYKPESVLTQGTSKSGGMPIPKPAGKTDEETLEDFITHMRWMNTNELNTIGEVNQVIEADEATRMQFGEAYKVYDELGGAFYNGGITGGLDALRDYGSAILTSPSTWLGGIAGRGAARAMTKSAQKKLITMTADKVGAAVAKTAGEAAGQVARGEVVLAGTKYSALKAAAIASGVDATLSVGVQDRAYQNIMMRTGVQEKWNYMQSALSALSGVTGGMVGYLPEMGRAVKLGTGLSDVGTKILNSRENKSAAALSMFRPRLKSAVEKLTVDWKKAVERGEQLDADKFLRNSAVDWFFSLENENSFVRMIQEAGVKVDRDQNKSLSEAMTEFAINLPKDFRKEYDKALKPLGVKFGEMIDIFSEVMSNAGTDQSKASLAQRFLNEYQNVAVAKRNAAGDIIAGEMAEKTEEVLHPRAVEYFTSVWKRALVSHPATTMANIKGWGFATGARAMAEMIHGGVLGTAGLTSKLVGANKLGDTLLSQSSAMFKSQIFMAKTMLDPYESVTGFFDLLEAAPKKYSREVLQSFSQGVDDKGPAAFGISKDNWIAKGAEKGLDVAQALSFVRVQDVYTKTFSGLRELDKQVRLKFNVGLTELIDRGDAVEISDEMWERTVKSLMEDTFSADYTKGKDVLSRLAKSFENAANAPGVGFIIPFARFMNNTVAFTSTYSPLGMIGPIFKVFKGDAGLDTQSRLIKGLVGTSILGHLVYDQEAKEREGLQWYEERMANGEVKNVANVFPQSAYYLTARAIHMVRSGQGITPDIWRDIAKMSPAFELTDVGEAGFLKDILATISDPSATAQEEMMEYVGLIGSLLTTMSGGVLSGFTRPLDPLNDMVGQFGYARGFIDNGLVDKKQSEGVEASLLQFSRYTNNFFNLFLGEEGEDGRKQFGKPLHLATEDGPARQANPMSDMFGTTIQTPATDIDRLLGMSNLPPWKQDSYDKDPDYNAFVDDNIFPLLEARAMAMLKSPAFMNKSPASRQALVMNMMSEARDDLLNMLDQGYVGGPNEILINNRRLLLKRPRNLVADAKKALGFTTEDRKLTQFQIEALQHWIDLQEVDNKALLESIK